MNDDVHDSRQVMVFATQGTGHGDERRILELLQNFKVDPFAFDRGYKVKSLLRLLRRIRATSPPMVVMEGTGAAGGFGLILARLLMGVPYVVSSGDAVAPFLSAKRPLLGPLFRLYERCLYRLSAGFIGWTPYLVGRALTLGARRGMTAAGWAPFPKASPQMMEARSRVRAQWDIPSDAIVFGIVGNLDWNRRVGYCYGSELVRAALRVNRPDLRIIIAGDGSGRSKLEELAGNLLGKSIVLAGRIPPEAVPDYLAAMDIGSLPQSVDGVGSFRYSTKLSEYLAAALPVVTGQIPMSYDLNEGWMWRLPGSSPWDTRYIDSLRQLMNSISLEQIQQKREGLPGDPGIFNKARQVERVTEFITDLLASRCGIPSTLSSGSKVSCQPSMKQCSV